MIDNPIQVEGLTGYLVTVFAAGEGAAQTNLGTVLVGAPDENVARASGLEALWDARLDSAGCSPDYDITALPRYLVVPDWDIPHALLVRFVLDHRTGKVVFMEVAKGAEGWVAATADQVGQVQARLADEDKDLLLLPDCFGADRQDELPAWALAAGSAPALPGTGQP